MKQILVPTDFSDDARNAAHYAARLAERIKAGITLLHAYMLPTPVSEVPYVMINAEEMQKENEDIARVEADKLRGTYKIEVNYIVRLGFPSDEIESVIEDHDIELVVMGMKGKGALEKMVGSTTTSTLKKIKSPLLIVPEKANYKDWRQVTYATDYSYEFNPSVYQSLLNLLRTFNAQLNIVHVMKPANEEKSQQKSGEQQMETVFNSVSHQYQLVSDAHVKHGIESYLQDHPTDLLVMVTRDRGFWERLFGKSHTKEMVYNTQIPLLVLKDSKEK
jgi:nucleotide-binding universal stress UspA family protein